MKNQSFNALIKCHDPGWHYVDMPFDAMETYGMSSRIPVKALVDGLAFRTSLLPGDEGHYMVINKAMREATGKGVGDTVAIEIDVDDGPREAAVPVDIQQALHRDKKAMELYTALSYPHRKRYIEWVEDAKKPETRAKRIAKLMEELRETSKKRT